MRTIRPIPPLSSLWTACLCATLVLVGCGSSEGSSQRSASGEAPNPCDLFSAEDAATIMDQPAARGEDPRAPAGENCIYTAGEEELMLTIMDVSGRGIDAETFVERNRRIGRDMGYEIERLSGLGQVGIWKGGDFPAVSVLAEGDYTVTASFMTSGADEATDRERLTRTVEILLARL